MNSIEGEPKEALLVDYPRVGTLLAHSSQHTETPCSFPLAAVRGNGLHAVPTEMQFLASTEE